MKISDITLAQEYQLLDKTFNWEMSHFKKCNLEAIQHSFAPRSVKEKVKFQIVSAYQN